ncbi:hypothetical protein HPB47_018203 [Ixodes persulcatus]|uniref:Uncharacterized protein n=1 Tax=Ixodes persulcatus TaxID=34615 RepID=A0AC60QLC7_IXOPE|nr:hypothetical protein HPB47_018203 [Ixodes persulcatus]
MAALESALTSTTCWNRGYDRYKDGSATVLKLERHLHLAPRQLERRGTRWTQCVKQQEQRRRTHEWGIAGVSKALEARVAESFTQSDSMALAEAVGIVETVFVTEAVAAAKTAHDVFSENAGCQGQKDA